jgi:hypothetical protein
MNGRIVEATAFIDQVLGWLEHHTLAELIDVVGTYLICYQVLSAAGDPRAIDLLAAGYRELQRQAATIGDPQRRQRFFEGSRTHRELRAAWDARR